MLEQLTKFLLPFLLLQQSHLVFFFLQLLPEGLQAGPFVLDVTFLLVVVTDFVTIILLDAFTSNDIGLPLDY